MRDEEPGAGGRGRDPGPGARHEEWTGRADGRGQVHQAGRDQFISHHYYLAGGPPAAGGNAEGAAGAPELPEPEEPEGNHRFAHHRAAWISALATVVAALIAALATLSQGDASAPSGGPTAQRPEETSAPEHSAEGGERWRGELVLAGLDGPGDKDLDARAPVATGSPDRDDVHISSLYDRFTLATHYGTEVAPWKGSRTPGHRDCAQALADGAVRRLDLAEGRDVCVRTGEGRVARLTVTRLPHSGVEPRVRFDAVVWNARRPDAG
ncbi:hypothetical protein [Streptomyces sp. HNM0574]|uniref:hypothetical protein n=1 Tax=Streptomyces sp. HNM0574 TaxID=2714954 RepID=UPI00146CBA8F|nr:hypothetical protein [Streptomyces sp. HNM0574]NLU65790.1 hypothetical protein [Streptomyces sp. HNM0574]